MRYSTPSSLNVDNMSLKSGFSNVFSHETPYLHRQRPHHGEALGGRGGVEVAFVSLFGKR
jgi:hypothetical protein